MDIHEEYTSDDTFSGKDTVGNRREGVGDFDNNSPPHSDEDEDAPFSWTPKTRSIFYRILLEKKFDPVGKLIIISKIDMFGFYPETNRP